MLLACTFVMFFFLISSMHRTAVDFRPVHFRDDVYQISIEGYVYAFGLPLENHIHLIQETQLPGIVLMYVHVQLF